MFLCTNHDPFTEDKAQLTGGTAFYIYPDGVGNVQLLIDKKKPFKWQEVKIKWLVSQGIKQQNCKCVEGDKDFFFTSLNSVC